MEFIDNEVVIKEENIEYELFDNSMKYKMVECDVSITLPSSDCISIQGFDMDLETVRYLYKAIENVYQLQGFKWEGQKVTFQLVDWDMECFETFEELKVLLQKKGEEITSFLEQMNFSCNIKFVYEYL